MNSANFQPIFSFLPLIQFSGLKIDCEAKILLDKHFFFFFLERAFDEEEKLELLEISIFQIIHGGGDVNIAQGPSLGSVATSI